MLVLAVIGLLCGIAMPHLSGILATIGVDTAANHLVAAHRRARIMAIARNQVMVLTVAPDRLTIQPRGQSIPVWSEEGPSADRVALAGSLRQFTFSPDGFTPGLSNATLDLRRGTAHRSVVISRLGRIRLVR